MIERLNALSGIGGFGPSLCGGMFSSHGNGSVLMPFRAFDDSDPMRYWHRQGGFGKSGLNALSGIGGFGHRNRS